MEEKIRTKHLRLKKQENDLENMIRKWERELAEHANENLDFNGICKKGGIKVGLWEGKNLTGIGGYEKCFPYGIITLEEEVQVSKVVSENPDPIWNEDFNLLNNKQQSEKHVELYFNYDI